MSETKSMVPYADMERMASAVAASGLFGIKSKEQALALMCVAQAEGRHPGSVANEYHIIQGRPALKADTMMARFQQAGGKVEWTSYTDQRVAAVFSHPSGGSVEVDWTMERARQAGLGGKDTWKSYPRQMLRSRVISEGVRTVYPGVSLGIYTPEEVTDFVPGPSGTVVFDGNTGEVLNADARKPASKPKQAEESTTQILPVQRRQKPPPTPDAVIKEFGNIGVPLAALELYLGADGGSKPKAEWDAEDLTALREFYRDKQAEAKSATGTI